MRCKLTAVSVVLVVLAFPLLAQASSFFMCSYYDNHSYLHTVNPTTGVITLVGEIQYNGKPQFLDDIAYCPQTNTLYGVSHRYLFSLTLPATPGAGEVVTASFIGSSTVNNVGLCVSPSGSLYAGSLNSPTDPGSLYTLNTDTGAATELGSFGSPDASAIGMAGDLAFGPDEVLYGSMEWAYHNDILAIIVQGGFATGIAITAPDYYEIASDIDGLVFLDDILYGVTTGSGAVLCTIDINTGEATPLFTLTGVHGATGLAPTPLPGSVLMLGSGLIGLGAMGWRRRRKT